MNKNRDFQISAYEGNLEDSNIFTKLKLTDEQKRSVSALWQQAPGIIGTEVVSKAYILEYPEGLPHTLMELKRGGNTATIVGENGKIAGTAALHDLNAQAVALGVFSAMSIASGQYFLSQINSELKMLKLSVDRILEFLYGEKKAELMAEFGFAKYAYDNYISIMEHEEQRTATISSIQESRKVAMKDIEFYMADLDRFTSVNSKMKIDEMTAESFKIKECLDLSIQLYTMTMLLEVFYSQNFDKEYLKSIEENIIFYTGKCDKRILGCFSSLKTCIDQYKAKPLEKLDKEVISKPVVNILEKLHGSGDSEIHKAVRKTMESVLNNKACYISEDGNIYRRIA